MNSKYFKQGMSHDEAMEKGMVRSNFPMVFHPDVLNKIDDQTASYPSRPDWDGYLTLSEANECYRNGNGQPLFVDASKIDLSPITTLDFSNGKKTDYFNFASPKYANRKTGLVYGTIRISLLNNNGEVKLGMDNGYLDNYGFEMQKGRRLRNIATKIGSWVEGNGTPFNIYNYGTAKIKVK